MTTLRLTESRIRQLADDSGMTWDSEVKGLCVRAGRSRKTYLFQGVLKRDGSQVRQVRKSIGNVGEVTLSEARQTALDWKQRLRRGEDVSRPVTKGMTLSEALERHLADKDLRPATEKSYRYLCDKYMSDLKGRACSSIDRGDVVHLRDTIERRSGRTSSSAVIRTLSAILGTAERYDEAVTNVARAVGAQPVPRRKVAPLDLKDWWERTEQLSPRMRDLHRFLLLTGARKASALRVRREDVDLEAGILTFTHLKTSDDVLMYPMGPRLRELVAKRLEEDGEEWLWPSETSESGRMTDAKVRPIGEYRFPSSHELRHHCRTMMIAAGVPYAESALLLGQRLPGASGGYVHPEMLVESLRPWSERYEAFTMGAVTAAEQ